MKIALAIKHYSLSKGGAERYAVHLSTALAEKGHDVHVFALQFDLHPSYPVKPELVHVNHWPSWWRNLAFAMAFDRLVLKRNFDIICGLTQVFRQDIHRMGGGIYKHWMHIRYPQTIHRSAMYILNPVHMVNLYLEKKIYQEGNYRKIITNSHLCKEQASRYYQVPEQRIEVVRNGIDHNKFNPEGKDQIRKEIRRNLGLSANTPLLLFVSNNWKRKGLQVVLRALHYLGESDFPFHLVVIGKGRPGAFRRLVKSLGLANRIHFIGPTMDVSDFYRASDLFVLPTLYDPFATVCLEAMACGIPVITTSSNGVSEIIQEGVNGYIQRDPTDEKELAKLIEVCSDKRTLKDMGKAARETSLPFSMSKNVQSTLEVFEAVLRERSKY